jgi:RNase adapter protein RapZ
MKKSLIIVGGLSGAGKTKALGAFEDLGYYTVENLPLELLTKFVELSSADMAKMQNMAVTLNYSSTEVEGWSKALSDAIENIRKSGVKVDVLFLEANTDTLIRRFQETKRKHPLFDNGGIFDAIQREQLKLKPLKKLSSQTIDTSTMSPHDLKIRLANLYSLKDHVKDNLAITLVSFGYRYGVPAEANLVMDIRFISNPYYDEKLRNYNGTNENVRNYVLADESAQQFLEEFIKLLTFLLPQYLAREGKSHLTVAFGCTGGKHRSVVITEEMGKRLTGLGYDVNIVHRDIEK